MVHVLVPAGSFLMGAEPEASSNPDERPQHTVTLDTFWIDRTEVSTGSFAAFVEAAGYQTSADDARGAYVWNGGGWTFVDGANWQSPQGPGQPAEANQAVTQVSWYDATAYCAWVGRRLPTEAEWERSVRGLVGSLYPWGQAQPSRNLANYAGHLGRVAGVDEYPDGQSAFGALQMAGNVYEWVEDWYSANYYEASPAFGPLGPSGGRYRVMRGGSWQLDGDRLRAFVREVSEPQYMNDNLGFRCAMDATQP